MNVYCAAEILVHILRVVGHLSEKLYLTKISHNPCVHPSTPYLFHFFLLHMLFNPALLKSILVPYDLH